MITKYTYNEEVQKYITLETRKQFMVDATDFIKSGGCMEDFIDRWISFDITDLNCTSYIKVVIYCYFEALYASLKRKQFKQYPFLQYTTDINLINLLVNEIRTFDTTVEYILGHHSEYYIPLSFIGLEEDNDVQHSALKAVQLLGDHPLYTCFPYIPCVPLVLIYALVLDKYLRGVK